MVIEPLGTIMSSQAQHYQLKKNISSQDNQINISNNADFDAMDIKKNTTVQEINKSELNKDNQKNSNNNLSEKDRKKIQEYVNKANKDIINKGTLFSIHEESNRMKITIINKETREIIKEFPPEKFLDAMAKRIELTGVVFDETR